MIRILAIDDNSDNLVVLKAILKEAFPDAVMITCESGRKGLQLFREEVIDIVLLDLIMPEMDGFDVLKFIRKDTTDKYIPVIILTAAGADREKRIRALEMGADAFLSKPVDEAELIAQINAMIRIREMEELKHNEAKRLARLVEEQTRELKAEMEERRLAEITLRESEERFRTIFERSDTSIILVSEDLKYIKVNPAYCEMTGYTEKELMVISLAEVTHKEDFIESRLMAARLWKGEIPNYKTEKRYIHKSGRIIWAYIAVNLVKDNNGEPLFFLTMINNITEKKLAEERLAKEQVLLKTLIDNLPQTIYVKDLEKRKILANKADLLVIGKHAEEVIGKSDKEVFPEEIARQFESDDDLVITSQKPIIDREELIINEKGRKVWFLTSKLPLFDHNGKLAGIVGIGHDISERKKAEEMLRKNQLRLKKQNKEYVRLNREYAELNAELSERLQQIRIMNLELQKAKEKAEESDKLKTAFLQNISHEIRTPLNAIIGFSSVIANDELPPAKRKEFIDIIYKSNDQLLSIISGIIAIASLELGQENCELTETNINQLLSVVYEQFQVTEVSNELSFSYHPGLPDDQATILTDQVKLTQILNNLVGNAIKFTNEGFVKFGYRKDNDMLVFFVEDSGIGIPEDMHELIFERFMQVDNSATRKYGGTGLGLALSRGYAKLLGGSISLHSVPGKGSEFYLRIPYQPPVS